MKNVFNHAHRQITDLTASTALWLDVNQDISRYASPLDLLMLDAITVRAFSIGRFMNAAREQRELVGKFLSEGETWTDFELRRKIIESAKNYGDLRYRSIVIPDIPYTHVRCFYSRMFEGVYVFRDILKKSRTLLVLADAGLKTKLGRGRRDILSLSDPMLFNRLLDEGILKIDLEYFHQHPEKISEIREQLFLDALFEKFPDIDPEKLTVAQKKKLVVELEGVIPDTFYESERLSKKIVRGEKINEDDIAYGLKRLIARPAAAFLGGPEREMVWRLISEIEPTDILRLYVYNKNLFFERYRSWPEQKKEWAVKFLKQNYVPWMSDTNEKERVDGRPA